MQYHVPQREGGLGRKGGVRLLAESGREMEGKKGDRGASAPSMPCVPGRGIHRAARQYLNPRTDMTYPMYLAVSEIPAGNTRKSPVAWTLAPQTNGSRGLVSHDVMRDADVGGRASIGIGT